MLEEHGNQAAAAEYAALRALEDAAREYLAAMDSPEGMGDNDVLRGPLNAAKEARRAAW